MLLKKRLKPPILLELEASILRLHPGFQRLSELEKALAREWKGYIGEKKVDYFLEQLADQFTILQDVYLKTSAYHIQIDNLIITPHAIYIIEVKNFNGTITFDTVLNQFIRDDGRKEGGFHHPITQVELQASRLERWLEENNFPIVPIIYFVAIAEPNTIIKVNGDKNYIASIVAHASNVPGKILETEKVLQGKRAVNVQHQKIGKLILDECCERNSDVRKNTIYVPLIFCLVYGVYRAGNFG